MHVLIINIDFIFYKLNGHNPDINILLIINLNIMKKITFLSFLLMGSMGFSQVNPIDFETVGNGAFWTWGSFANGTDPALQVIDNPDVSGANTSAKVAQVTAEDAGEEFAGFFTNDVEQFTINATNSTVRMKVWKPVISDVGFKIEGPNGNLPIGMGELKVPNTLVNQWEEITFDFSPYIGQPAATGLVRIVFFPDFAPRNQDNVIYIDDITFSAILGVDEFQSANFKVYPNPATDTWTIKSQNSLINSMELIDIQGKQVMLLKPNALEMKVDTANLSQGIYIARINSGNGVETLKLVKQ